MKAWKNSLSIELFTDIQTRLADVLADGRCDSDRIKDFADSQVERYSSCYANEVRAAVREGVKEFQSQLRADGHG